MRQHEAAHGGVLLYTYVAGSSSLKQGTEVQVQEGNALQQSYSVFTTVSNNE